MRDLRSFRALTRAATDLAWAPWFFALGVMRVFAEEVRRHG